MSQIPMLIRPTHFLAYDVLETVQREDIRYG